MKILKLMLILLFSAGGVLAQTQCGIYTNRTDFLKGTPSVPLACGSEIKVPVNKDLVVKSIDGKVRFRFPFVYGYSDGKHLYRSYGSKRLWRDHGYYKIIHNSDIVIYSRQIMDSRTRKVMTLFYYSQEEDSPIQPLKRRQYKRINAEEVLINLAAIRGATVSPTPMLNIGVSEGI